MSSIERGVYAERDRAPRVLDRAKRLAERAREKSARVAELPIVDEGKGIFAYKDLKKMFTRDGALKTSTDPRTTKYGAFFRKKGRFFEQEDRTGKKYLLRGLRYATVIDPTADYKERVSILAGDFGDALKELSGKGRFDNGRQNFVMQQALLDTVKNSATSLFNALIADERSGELRLGAKKYQELRSAMEGVTERAVEAQYSHLAGEIPERLVAKLVKDTETIRETELHLKRLRVRHEDSAKALYARELNHPLAIGASALYTAELGYRHLPKAPHVIIGLATGGTEYAFALQYAFYKLTGERPKVVTLALSLHSKPKEGSQDRIEAGLGDEATREFFAAHGIKLNRERVMIADDNSATGETIETLINTINHNYSVAGDIEVSVAQANPLRMKHHVRKERKTFESEDVSVDVASPRIFGNSASLALEVNGKPLYQERNLRRIKVERKKDAERTNASLALSFAYKARQAAIENKNSINRILKKALIEGKPIGRDKLIMDFDLKDDTGTIYENTFLSNFFSLPRPLVYGIPTTIDEETEEVSERDRFSPRAFPTSEHAYQCAKFLPRTLGRIAQSQTLTAHVLKSMKMYYDSKNMVMPSLSAESFSPQSGSFVFSDPSISPTDIKTIARVFSNLGYERSDWYETRLTIMAEILLKKFEDPELKEQLLATGDALLVEFNKHQDSFFGVVESGDRFVGSNHLGSLLMEIRKYYRNPPRKKGAK